MKWVGGLGTVFTAVVVAFLLFRQYNDIVVTVHPIGLPPALKATDNSEAVLTNEIISVAQNLLNIRDGSAPQAVQIEEDCFDAATSIHDLRQELAKEFDYNVRIDQQRQKDYFEGLADNLARHAEVILPFYRRRSVDIRGEVTDKSNQLSLVLTATFSGGKSHAAPSISAPNKDALVKLAGKELIRFSTPWLYASTAAFSDTKDDKQTLNILIDEFPFNDRSLVLAMKGFTFLYSNTVSNQDSSLESADNAFAEALIINPNSYWALIGHARVKLTSFKRGKPGPKTTVQWSDYREAEENLQKAIRKNPSNPESYGILYVLYVLKGDQQKAAEQRQFFTIRATEQQQYFRSMGTVIALSATLGRPDGIKEALKELDDLKAQPGPPTSLEHTSLLRSRGLVAAKARDIAEFERIGGEAYRKRNSCLLVELARFALHASENEKEIPARVAWLKQSAAHHEYAREAGAKGFHFYNNWGAVNFRLGDYEQAIGMYKRALEFYGDTTWAFSNWGNALYAQGKFHEAGEEYLQAMTYGQTRASVEGLLKSKLQQSLIVPNPSMKKEALTALLTMFAKQELEWPYLTPGSYDVASYAHCLLGNKDLSIAYAGKMNSQNIDSAIPLEFAHVNGCIKGKTGTF